MFDIYEFINSKDIRQYCEEIGHTFTAYESAFLIYKSYNHTLQEKCAAWNELIEIMSDVEIEKRHNCPHYDSLHNFLKQYMNLNNRLLDDFFDEEENYVYRFDILYRPQSYYCGCDGDTVIYHGYEEGTYVYKSFFDGFKDHTFNSEKIEDVLNFSVLKMKIRSIHSENGKEIRIRINQEGKPLEVVDVKNILTEEEEDLLAAFDGMWINVPTPFQKGNIVFTNYQKKGIPAEPFVLTQLCTDKDNERDCKRIQKLLKKGDSSDMTAYGYRIDNNNEFLYYECDHDYLNLEYYRGNLNGRLKILKIIQAYYKKK